MMVTKSHPAWEVCVKAAAEGGWVVIQDFDGVADHISLVLDGLRRQSAIRRAVAAAADEQGKAQREQHANKSNLRTESINNNPVGKSTSTGGKHDCASTDNQHQQPQQRGVTALNQKMSVGGDVQLQGGAATWSAAQAAASSNNRRAPTPAAGSARGAMFGGGERYSDGAGNYLWRLLSPFWDETVTTCYPSTSEDATGRGSRS